MNRRKFLGTSINACASSILLGSMASNTFARSKLLQAIAASPCDDRVLVLVQLNGGNDGLNTIVPLNEYDALNDARSNILIPESDVIATTRYSDTGFHPNTSGLHELFENNRFSIVQGCSYENPDFSHFRATDIWMSASDASEFLDTGWLGRTFDEMYPDFPEGFPSDEHPDPVAIQMGSITSLTLQGSDGNFGLAVTSISREYALLNSFGDPAPENRAGCELDYIRQVAMDTESYNQRILEAADNQSENLADSYGDDRLSDQLKKVARLIKGGLNTKVYVVSLSGFDTHASQTEDDTTTGTHADLIQMVNDAIYGFQDDLELMDINNKVTGLVFSEFGRRVHSNASSGTDHGTAMPVMLFGTELIGDMYGSNPQLTDPDSGDVVDNVPMQYDYRSVYYSVLKDWFCLSESQLSSVFGGDSYEHIQLFNSDVVTSNPEDVEKRGNDLKSIYPHPMGSYANISFYTTGGVVRLDLYGASGNYHQVIMNKTVPKGAHEVKLERGNMKSGLYIVKMQCNGYSETKKLVVQGDYSGY